MLVGQGSRQLIAGLLFGLPLAFLVAPKLTHVFGDGQTQFVLLFLTVALMVTLIVILAIWLPSRRVIRMSPADAIRCD
ncbi:hypothetical protein D3C85_1828730 [compost metagenome]